MTPKVALEPSVKSYEHFKFFRILQISNGRKNIGKRQKNSKEEYKGAEVMRNLNFKIRNFKTDIQSGKRLKD